MKLFAELFDRLAHAPGDDVRVELLADYFRQTPDPDRGAALSLLLDKVDFPRLSPAMLRKLGSRRLDQTLFGMSKDFIKDLAETVALLWPARVSNRIAPGPDEVLATLSLAPRADLPEIIEAWLDTIGPVERWVLLMVASRRLRAGVTPDLMRRALAAFGGVPVTEIEELWDALERPYSGLFQWLEGRGGRPTVTGVARFHAMMRGHAGPPVMLSPPDPSAFLAEWIWRGRRLQLSARGGRRKIFSEGGDEVSADYPEIVRAMNFEGVLDAVVSAAGEKAESGLRVFDVLVDGAEDIRDQPLSARRERLGALLARIGDPVFELSPEIRFRGPEDLRRLHRECRERGAGGLILKRRDGRYISGPATGDWFRWPSTPRIAEAVLMYMHHARGTRTAIGAEATFGVWRHAADGPKLVSVGKAVLDGSVIDAGRLEQWVRDNTIRRHGPVTEVVPALVVELAYHGVDRAARRKAGLVLADVSATAIRWEKPASDAVTLKDLERLLP